MAGQTSESGKFVFEAEALLKRRDGDFRSGRQKKEETQGTTSTLEATDPAELMLDFQWRNGVDGFKH